jgi:DNA adenine methylase
MYRVGPNGFNVPYGNYKNPEILNRDHITEIHRLIQNVEFECCDFSASLQRVLPGDYVYVDPPYAPVNSSSFVGYTESGFDMDQHKALFGFLQETNKKFMMSNADVDFVREHFRGAKYNIETVSCRRAINARNPESRVNEVIIRNY